MSNARQGMGTDARGRLWPLSPAGKLIGPTCFFCGFEHLPSDTSHWREVAPDVYRCKGAEYVQLCKDTRADGRRCAPRHDLATGLPGDAFAGNYMAPREHPR
jgi:hypothetical protein